MYKVSVIMPVYNNEATLNSAVDSILNQSVFDFELILIDDGSTDSSAQICTEYTKREPLIVQAIHQERLGFAKARNKGLNLAKGSYIYFADAKNIFAPRMLETNVKLAEEKNAELVVFGLFDALQAIEQVPNMPFLLSTKRFRNHYRNFHQFFPYELCNKLYKVQYLKERDIKFQNVPLKEKTFFNLDVYQELNRVVFNRQVYCLKQDDASIEPLHEENLWDINFQLIASLERMFVDWERTEEFADVIIREYYELLKNQVVYLSSPVLNLSKQELAAEIDRLFVDGRIMTVLNAENKLSTRSLYERTLWNSFQKRNNRVIIALIQRKKQTKNFTQKIKGSFNKWFNN